MTKYQVVVITSLTVLVFIVGCPPTERKLIDSTEDEVPKFEPAETEPNLFEPNQAEPNAVEPVKTGPGEVGPIEIEPNEVGPNEAEPGQAEPNVIKPARAEPNEVESGKAEPNEVKQPPDMIFKDKCADILSSFVDDEGMVDYRKLKLRRLKLRQLLEEFAELDTKEYKSWPKEDKIAFWINAYNLQLLRIIVENYPIEPYRLLTLLPGWEPDSIRHINKRIDGINKQKFIIMDEEFTLLRVEQRFFRKEFDEPRAFLALSYATLSSPPLRNEPYYGSKLDEQLNDQARKFLSNPLTFKVDRSQKRVYLSSILQPASLGSEFISKYGTDKKFKDQEPAVRAVFSFLTNYISERDKDFLEVENYTIEYMKYNWRLNDSSRK